MQPRTGQEHGIPFIGIAGPPDGSRRLTGPRSRSGGPIRARVVAEAAGCTTNG